MNFRTVVRTTALASCLIGSGVICRWGVTQPSPRPELLYTLAGDGTPTWGIAFSPRGDLLASSSEDGTVKLRALASGRLRRVLNARAGAAGAVAFSPDGSTLAAGYADGSAKVWDVASGRPAGSLPGVNGPVAYSPDGRLLATAGDNLLKVWDTHAWKVVATLPSAHLPPSPVSASVGIGQVAFAPDGKSLATVQSVFHEGEPGMPDDFVQLWDTGMWRVRRSLHESPGFQIQVCFSPDSRHLAVAAGWINRGNVLLWNTASGETRTLLSLDDIDTVSSIVYDPHGRWVAFATQAGARFVDVASAKQFLVLDVGGSAFGPKQVYALSPNGRLLAAIREYGAVEIWRLPANLEGANPAPAANGPKAPRARSAP